MNRTAATRRQAGFTLIELCTAASISAALLSQALPSMSALMDGQRLKAASSALIGDLSFARSESQRLNDTVHFRISAQGENACYLIHTGAEGDCDCAGGVPVCKGQGAVIKAHWLPASQPVLLSSNIKSMGIEARRGLVSPAGSVELRLPDGRAIKQVVAITGRVRSCASGSAIAGLKNC
jgi:hypothetical protein